MRTELGTLLLYVQGVQNGWHVVPDRQSAQAALNDIERSTLGGLISTLKKRVRNRRAARRPFCVRVAGKKPLENHGFYERHNFKIETDEGRGEMFADLEKLHTELFNAWQIARTMTELATKALEGAASIER